MSRRRVLLPPTAAAPQFALSLMAMIAALSTLSTMKVSLLELRVFPRWQILFRRSFTVQAQSCCREKVYADIACAITYGDQDAIRAFLAGGISAAGQVHNAASGETPQVCESFWMGAVAPMNSAE